MLYSYSCTVKTCVAANQHQPLGNRKEYTTRRGATGLPGDQATRLQESRNVSQSPTPHALTALVKRQGRTATLSQRNAKSKKPGSGEGQELCLTNSNKPNTSNESRWLHDYFTGSNDKFGGLSRTRHAKKQKVLFFRP